MKRKVIIGLTYGDVSGIGPEILAKVLNNWKYELTPVVIGSKSVLKKFKLKDNRKIIFYPSAIKDFKFIPGKPSSASGQDSYDSLKEAAKLALNGKINALVTGPVSKETINKAGIKFSGQTEALAKLANVNPKKAIMIFVSRDLRIALFTRHIALKNVYKQIDKTSLEKFILILNGELKKWFKIKNPRIGLLGLNPHAGENGLFGDEEKKVISKIIASLKKRKINIYGPLSPDATLAMAGQDYLLKKKQKYDVYVSLYHDQALPMFKAVAGLDGVNVTFGLPFLRVSVDHGTAFNIAGKNKASEKGLESAIEIVDKLFL